MSDEPAPPASAGRAAGGPRWWRRLLVVAWRDGRAVTSASRAAARRRAVVLTTVAAVLAVGCSRPGPAGRTNADERRGGRSATYAICGQPAPDHAPDVPVPFDGCPGGNPRKVVGRD